jgi:hypothetical protein
MAATSRNAKARRRAAGAKQTGSAWFVLALLLHRMTNHWGTPQPTERST